MKYRSEHEEQEPGDDQPADHVVPGCSSTRRQGTVSVRLPWPIHPGSEKLGRWDPPLGKASNSPSSCHETSLTFQLLDVHGVRCLQVGEDSVVSANAPPRTGSGHAAPSPQLVSRLHHQTCSLRSPASRTACDQCVTIVRPYEGIAGDTRGPHLAGANLTHRADRRREPRSLVEGEHRPAAAETAYATAHEIKVPLSLAS